MWLYRLINSIEPNFGKLILLTVVTVVLEKVLGLNTAIGIGIFCGTGIAVSTKIRLKLFLLPPNKICQILALVAIWFIMLITLAGGIFLSGGHSEYAFRLFSIAGGWSVAFIVVIASTYELPPRKRKRRKLGTPLLLFRKWQSVPAGFR